MNEVKEKYKKFMFNRRFDKNDEELALAESEIKDILSSSNFAEAEGSEEIEKIITETEAVIPPPEPVEAPPSYTQEQLDNAIEQAKKEGIEIGKKETEEKISKQEADALVKIEKDITSIKTEIENYTNKSQKEFIEFCGVLFKKLMPEFEKKGGFHEIEGILNTYFPRLYKEPKLRLIMNQQQTPILKEKISTLVKKIGFLGKIVIQNKEELNLSDIKIEWDKGGIERNSEVLTDEVEKIIALYSSQKESVEGEK